MMNRRVGLMWAVALVVLIVTNSMIAQKELIIRNGQVIFLDLAPRDPRSLIQGDYMALNYALVGTLREPLPPDGMLALQVDAAHIVRTARLITEQTPLATGELRLTYRMRGGMVYLGAESFFFQEGQAKSYATARYAELRVAESGESVLIGLRGPQLEILAPEPNRVPWWERYSGGQNG